MGTYERAPGSTARVGDQLSRIHQVDRPEATRHCGVRGKARQAYKPLVCIRLHFSYFSCPGEWWFKRVHTPAAIDYACGHLWVQNWGYYDPTVANATSLGSALAFANEFLGNVSQWSLDIGKVSSRYCAKSWYQLLTRSPIFYCCLAGRSRRIWHGSRRVGVSKTSCYCLND